MPGLCGRPGKATSYRFVMKLLFDQNLSFRLCQNLADLFPESSHVRLLGLSEAGDLALWDYAKTRYYGANRVLATSLSGVTDLSLDAMTLCIN
jgi:predicted nuclease of predicted toxin-antitoxin system